MYLRICVVCAFVHLCICVFVYLCICVDNLRQHGVPEAKVGGCIIVTAKRKTSDCFDLSISAHICVFRLRPVCVFVLLFQLYDEDRLPARSLQFKFAPINFVQQNMCVRSTSGATEWRHDCLADRWVHALDANWHQSGQQFSQIHKNSVFKTQMHKYTNTQKHKCTNTQIQIHGQMDANWHRAGTRVGTGQHSRCQNEHQLTPGVHYRATPDCAAHHNEHQSTRCRQIQAWPSLV